jgi:hypothetical protein
MLPSNRMQRLSRWGSLFLIAFTLNAIWEIAQSPLYAWEVGRESVLVCLWAAGEDALIILGLVTLVTFVTHPVEPFRFSHFGFTLLAGLGLGGAVFIETRALFAGSWSYGPLMPTIASLGLSPLLQLTLLPGASVLVARKTGEWLRSG